MQVCGTVQSAGMICGCVFLGLCMRGSSSVVKLLGGRGAIVVVSSRWLVSGTVHSAPEL